MLAIGVLVLRRPKSWTVPSTVISARSGMFLRFPAASVALIEISAWLTPSWTSVLVFAVITMLLANVDGPARAGMSTSLTVHPVTAVSAATESMREKYFIVRMFVVPEALSIAVLKLLFVGEIAELDIH